MNDSNVIVSVVKSVEDAVCDMSAIDAECDLSSMTWSEGLSVSVQMDTSSALQSLMNGRRRLVSLNSSQLEDLTENVTSVITSTSEDELRVDIVDELNSDSTFTSSEYASDTESLEVTGLNVGVVRDSSSSQESASSSTSDGDDTLSAVTYVAVGACVAGIVIGIACYAKGRCQGRTEKATFDLTSKLSIDMEMAYTPQTPRNVLALDFVTEEEDKIQRKNPLQGDDKGLQESDDGIDSTSSV